MEQLPETQLEEPSTLPTSVQSSTTHMPKPTAATIKRRLIQRRRKQSMRHYIGRLFRKLNPDRQLRESAASTLRDVLSLIVLRVANRVCTLAVDRQTVYLTDIKCALLGLYRPNTIDAGDEYGADVWGAAQRAVFAYQKSLPDKGNSPTTTQPSD